MSPFVIITPAHNEEAFIGRTILSVINQTLLPFRWIIVNDASDDRTAEIVNSYASQHAFIKPLTVKRPQGRHFGNKVSAFNLAVAQLDTDNYKYIGNLDADICLPEDYFQRLLLEFQKDPKLGIGGGMVHTFYGQQYVSQNVALDSVAGAVQLFHRDCFVEIGGYLSLPYGGIDAAAEITARMKGWRVRTFPELAVFEQRLTGSASATPLMSRIKEGRRMHSLGYGLLFFLARCLYRVGEKPRVLGSAAAILGFLSRMMSGDPVLLPQELVRFLRAEQRNKLRRLARLSQQ
jgi:glycosyltransferase involved in cell wall biosynthesis